MVQGGAGRGLIKVAIMEQRDETLQLVLALAAQSSNLSVQVLKDAAAYFEIYDSTDGPDVLLVGLDNDAQAALHAARRVVALAPSCGVIVYGRAATMDLLSQAMAAGARRYLPFPFDTAALRTAVGEVYEQVKPLADSARLALPAHPVALAADQKERDPKVIAVFSPKGGVGTSTLAVNLACALGTMGRRVAIVDGNISFGNVGVFLNISPSKSMLQLVGDPHGIQEASVDDVLLPHPSGIKVMLAPLKPEEADTINGDHLRTIINILRLRYDYVVVDTWPSYDERVLAMLDASDQILVPTGPELPSIKNIAAFLRVAQLLEYPHDKIIPVLMRANSVSPGYLADIEAFLKQPLVWRVVSDGKRVTQSVNNGEPFVLTDPSAAVSQNIFSLARMLDGTVEELTPAVRPEAASVPFWKRFRLGLSRAS